MHPTGYSHNQEGSSSSAGGFYYPPPSSTAEDVENVLDPLANSRLETQKFIQTRQESVGLNSKRLKAFEEIDNAIFTRFHLKVCLIAAVGFFIDAYDFFAIDVVATILTYRYYTFEGKEVGSALVPVFLIKIAAPIGALIGQLLFGLLGDLRGRKKMYGTELTIICIATLAQAVAGGGDAVNVFYVIFLWRILMGIGNGGDYPLTAIITSEFSPIHVRGRLMTAVFSMQGWGQTASAIVSLIAVSAFSPTNSDAMWRLIIGFGCVPTVIALYLRTTVPETPRFTMDIERNVDQACDDIENFLSSGTFVVDKDATVQKVDAPRFTPEEFITYFYDWENMKVLIGVCWSWFVLDIAFYGLSQNSSSIIQILVKPNNTSPQAWRSTLRQSVVTNLGFILGGQVPGFIVSFFLIDIWGRTRIQFLGFGALTIVFLIMGGAYEALVKDGTPQKVFFFFCFLANFFMNFGPNTTTFIIPAEHFPTRFRSTAYGIAAACGKLGAIIVQIGFLKVKATDTSGSSALRWILIALGPVMLTGLVSTYLIPETNQKSLEINSNEEQRHYIHGLVHPITLSG